jgi:hypothetical protein
MSLVRRRTSTRQREEEQGTHRDSEDCNKGHEIDPVVQFKEETARLLVQHGGASRGHLRPSEILAQKRKLDKKDDPDIFGEEYGNESDFESDSISSSHSDFLDDSDDDDSDEAAETLLSMPSHAEDEIKICLQEQEGSKVVPRKATWVWAARVIAQACLIAAGIVHLLSGGRHAPFQVGDFAFS